MTSAGVTRPTRLHHHHRHREVVLGVDTHKDAHVAAVVSTTGKLIASCSFSATSDGYRQLLDWARSHGTVDRAGVECTGSYGAALSRFLRGSGVGVIEVNQPDKATRRRRGKTDAIDAEAAAHAVLSGRATATAKLADGPAEALRLFKMAKVSGVKARTQAINQLRAVLVTANPDLREPLDKLTIPKLVRARIALPKTAAGTATAAAVFALRLLARRVEELDDEIAALKQQITDVISRHTPQLLECYGVGPDTAATLLIATGDTPERLRSEASFASLCGVSPVEASSGKTQRRRLNRGGDRQANSALCTIVLARLCWETRSRSYVERRIAEGKTRREAIRCLKRYVARELYTIIIRAHTTSQDQALAA
ncbi:IS110 family transposase [Streptomyces sp. TLI_105]|uniref:IS110 family transposase n=1 Tax=Streptomyces sp. TLI_105 TaxID=1881019 RepID=UPI000894B45B|nr:IS110 family transposase [Streptomyces sp. TLI_105]SEB88140.1 Transposase [Streptomyces sp. TLI_105]